MSTVEKEKEKDRSTHIQTIRRWIALDNEIKQLKINLKTLGAQHKTLMTQIVDTMKADEVDTYAIGGGKLVRKKRKEKSAITIKYLTAELNAYFAETPHEGTRLTEHLIANRREITRDLLERKKVITAPNDANKNDP